MSALTTLILLSVALAIESRDSTCNFLDIASINGALTGNLQNGLTACNNYTYNNNIPIYLLDGSYYVQKRTKRPEQEDFRCGYDTSYSIFGTNIAIHDFGGNTTCGSFVITTLDIALSNGQFRSITLDDPTDEITFDIVAYECGAGYAMVVCRWDKTAQTPIYMEVSTKEQFPDPALVNRLMQAAKKSGAPTDNDEWGHNLRSYGFPYSFNT